MQEAFLVFPQVWPAASYSARLRPSRLSELQQTSETPGTGQQSGPKQEETQAF